jgi:DNA-directed RNA polymerase subunit RPC12/RpoP
MHVHRLDGAHGTRIDIDVCYDCNALWFDQSESTRLSPDGVIELFGLIHQRGKTAARPFPENMACVRCGDGLFEVSDLVRTQRFKYRRCPGGHGRLTSFYHFLIEKQFVRTLTKPEREQLCASVKQIKCSSCGAPVDITHHDACPYCKSPITVLDRAAAEKAVKHYLEARSKQPARPAGMTHTPSRLPTRPTSPMVDRYNAGELAVDAVDVLAMLAGHRILAAGLGLASAGAIADDDGASLSGLALEPMESVTATSDWVSAAGEGAAAVGEAAGEGLVDGGLDLVSGGVSVVFEVLGGIFD